MSHYILLEKISVENANTIAGITYGFPAITQFLGFTHALSRRLKKDGLEFDGCAVICHDHNVDTYKRYRDHYFVQKKTSPSALLSNRSKAHETPPIIEEGKMDMTVSILLRSQIEVGNDHQQQLMESKIREQLFQSCLAGGSIFACQSIRFYTNSSDLDRIKRRLLPGFVLMDATDKLQQYLEASKTQNDQRELFDLWSDFFTYRAKAIANTEEDLEDESIRSKKSKKNPKANIINWEMMAKPAAGWLVPLMVGYKGISPLYDANEVANVRDQRYPFRFVESVHSIGEWKGMHRIKSLEEIIWQYQIEDEWYLCTQSPAVTKEIELTEESHNVFDSLFEE